MLLTSFMTILYVDDDADDRQIFEEAVKSLDAGHKCVTERDGLGALTYLSNHPPPDIIFLDLNMPMMDGKTCLAEIRGNKKTKRLPVIIFTTSGSPGDKSQCQQLGATDYVLKPVSFVHMREILRAILRSADQSLFTKNSIGSGSR